MPKPLLKKCMTQMKSAWGKVGAQDYWVEQQTWGFTMTTGKITAMSRLVKSRIGMDYIAVD